MFGFAAVAFEGQRAARQALDALEEMMPEHVCADNIAVVSRSRNGAVHIHCKWAHEDSERNADHHWGMMSGGLVRLMFVSGSTSEILATGGSLRTTEGDAALQMASPALKAFAQALGKDTSALLLVSIASTLDNFLNGTAPLGGKIIRGDLNVNDIARLRESIQPIA